MLPLPMLSPSARPATSFWTPDASRRRWGIWSGWGSQGAGSPGRARGPGPSAGFLGRGVAPVPCGPGSRSSSVRARAALGARLRAVPESVRRDASSLGPSAWPFFEAYWWSVSPPVFLCWEGGRPRSWGPAGKGHIRRFGLLPTCAGNQASALQISLKPVRPPLCGLVWGWCCSEEGCLAGSLGPFLGLFSVLSVSCGAILTSGLVRDGDAVAVPAEAEFLCEGPLLTSLAPLEFLPFRPLVTDLFVLPAGLALLLRGSLDYAGCNCFPLGGWPLRGSFLLLRRLGPARLGGLGFAALAGVQIRKGKGYAESVCFWNIEPRACEGNPYSYSAMSFAFGSIPTPAGEPTT